MTYSKNISQYLGYIYTYSKFMKINKTLFLFQLWKLIILIILIVSFILTKDLNLWYKWGFLFIYLSSCFSYFMEFINLKRYNFKNWYITWNKFSVVISDCYIIFEKSIFDIFKDYQSINMKLISKEPVPNNLIINLSILEKESMKELVWYINKGNILLWEKEIPKCFELKDSLWNFWVFLIRIVWILLFSIIVYYFWTMIYENYVK